MKKLSLALAALALCGASNAGTAVGNFTVTVTFTSACTLTGSPVVAFGNYTAFAPAITAPTVNFSVACSRNTTITAIDYDTASDNGYFPTAGLQYLLTLPSIPTLSAGLAASAAGIGGPDTGSISIIGNLPSQAGINNNGTPPGTPEVSNRTLTITF